MNDTTRNKIWHDIESRHLGRCFAQMWASNRRQLFEIIEHRASQTLIVVEKTYDMAVPKSGSRPWPDLSGVQVFVPLAKDNMTWEALDAALTAYI